MLDEEFSLSELIGHLVSKSLVILARTLIAWPLWNTVVAGTFHVTCLSYLQVLAIYLIIHVIK